MSRIAQTLGKCQDLKTPHHEFCLILAGGLEAGLSKPKCMIQPEHLPGQPFLLHTANAPPTPPTPSRAGRGTCRPPDLRPALEDMSPLQSLSRSVSLSGDNFVPSSGERKTRFSILQNLKNRLMKMLEVLKERTGVVLAHKEGLPLSAAGSTIQNQ